MHISQTVHKPVQIKRKDRILNYPLCYHLLEHWGSTTHRNSWPGHAKQAISHQAIKNINSVNGFCKYLRLDSQVSHLFGGGVRVGDDRENVVRCVCADVLYSLS